MRQNSQDSNPAAGGPALSRGTPRSWMLVFYLCSFAASTAAALLWRGLHPDSLGTLANFMGPLSESLAHGRGYQVCTDAMTAAGNTLCYRAARMPLPPWLVAGLIRVFHDNTVAVELAKIALVLVPVAAAVSLAAGRNPSRHKVLLPAFLLAALLLPTQLIDVLNLQVEEGYSFCLLAYAVAVLLFAIRDRAVPWPTALSFAGSVLGLYLTKSSMILAAFFLVFMFCAAVRDMRQRVAVLLIVLAGPLGWGIYTARATGQARWGTSLDGINLHKGNRPRFLAIYPPADGGSLDRYDAALNAGLHFDSEWQFNRVHMQLAEQYIRAHPGSTLRAAGRKAEVFFLSFRKIGSESYQGWLGAASMLSMVLFRLLLWTACIAAFWMLVRGAQRFAASLYLGTTAVVALPYIAGFALTRHAGVLALPSALYLCHQVARRSPLMEHSS